MKVSSHLIAVYLKPNKENAAGKYYRVGSNCESLTINNNAEEEDIADVTMEVKQSKLKSVKWTIEGSGDYDDTDEVYGIFYDLFTSQAVLDAAKCDALLVFRNKNNEAFEISKATVVVNSFALTGADSATVDFKISQNEAPKKGTATVSADDNYKTATFTASES